MMMLGFAGVGLVAYRRKSRSSFRFAGAATQNLGKAAIKRPQTADKVLAIGGDFVIL